jgi:prepilin-type N-terminal cleavage/methylation domain-containing protein
MKPVAKQTRHRRAFTIIELLTVMSIIVILIGLMVPALNQVKQYATNVKEKAQLKSIEAALELFSSQYSGYPDSTYVAAGTTGPDAYCGALKLGEAMMGKDLMGYHPDSIFRQDGTDGLAPVRLLYTPATLAARPGAFLPLENANAYPLGEIYRNLGTFDPCDFVLCDVYNRVTNIRTGRKMGMPILYYKANTSRQSHDLRNPNNPDNIYNWLDNNELVKLGKPWDPTGTPHRLLSYVDPKGVAPTENPGERFYKNTRNEQVSIWRPYRADTYILISAGWDGEYGTADDVCNYEWRFRD